MKEHFIVNKIFQRQLLFPKIVYLKFVELNSSREIFCQWSYVIEDLTSIIFLLPLRIKDKN